MNKRMTASARRSDTVRRTRQQRTTKKRKTRKVTNASTMSRTMPPMVRRSGGMARQQQATAARGRKPTRHTLSVPLRGTPGAELRLPAMPKMKVGWRVISASLALILGWALYALWNSPNFVVNTAEVKGLERMSSYEISALMKVSGKPVFTIDPKTVENNLRAAFPALTDVKVSVGFPAKVIVEVGERYPVISWNQSGVEAWIDANGIGFMPNSDAVDWLVPVIAEEAPATVPTDDGDQRLIMPEMVQAILTLYESAPEGQVIVYDGQHGLGWTDPRGWKVYFGVQPDDMEMRLAVYRGVVEFLDKRGIVPAMISVEYVHAPYYRLNESN
jgi:hypothetical protein